MNDYLYTHLAYSGEPPGGRRVTGIRKKYQGKRKPLTEEQQALQDKNYAIILELSMEVYLSDLTRWRKEAEKALKQLRRDCPGELPGN